jgi:ATP-binding cassette, subfamily C, type I secretion system permease/ATPase
MHCLTIPKNWPILNDMQMKKQSFLDQVVFTSRKAFGFVGLFSFFVNMLMLTVPLYMLQLFDRVLASRSYDTLLYLTLIAIVGLGVLALLDMARSRIMIRVSSWLDYVLSPVAIAKSADEILQGRTYGPQSLRDINSIRQFLGGTGVFALFDSPWVPVFLLVIFLLHPMLGVFALFGAIALFALALTNEIMTREPLSEANTKSIETLKQTDLAMRNAEVIQAMGMMPSIIERWYKKNAEVLSAQLEANNRASIILSSSKFLRLALQLLMLGLGAFFVVKGQLTPGAMIAASILLTRALAPVEQAIGAWKQLVAARQAYHRLEQHFQMESQRGAGIQLPTPKGLVTVEGMSFVPPGQRHPILYNINYQFKPASMVAIIGPAAAGKSSMARLIVGAWKATTGSIRLDGADVYTWDRTDFGKHVGYLPQDVELFTGTVKENIARLGEPDDEAVIAAAQMAGVHELILRLPEGYDTMVDSSAYQLSGGQRQRIALARALYKQPKLLVLDEPNSNLDSQGEDALTAALVKMRELGSTIIVIAHRPHIVKHVDEIIVLNAGKIQFAGPRDQILKQMQEIAQASRQPLQQKRSGE